MSVDEFWRGDPDLFWAYRFSYLEKVKRENQIFNNRAWLQGAYYFEAISVALSRAFGDKNVEYSHQPYELYGDNQKKENLKHNFLEDQIKARAKQIEKLLGGIGEK